MIKLSSKQVAVEPIYGSDYFNPLSKLIKIPGFAKDRCNQGIVKYIGSEVDPEITIGSHVIFSGYTGTLIAVDDEQLILMQYNFIKAIISTENYIVPGLYYKSRVDIRQLDDYIDKKLKEYSRHNFISSIILSDIMLKVMEYVDNLMIPANYEKIVNLVSTAYSDWNTNKVIVKREDEKEQRDPFEDNR